MSGTGIECHGTVCDWNRMSGTGIECIRDWNRMSGTGRDKNECMGLE